MDIWTFHQMSGDEAKLQNIQLSQVIVWQKIMELFIYSHTFHTHSHSITILSLPALPVHEVSLWGVWVRTIFLELVLHLESQLIFLLRVLGQGDPDWRKIKTFRPSSSSRKTLETTWKHQMCLQHHGGELCRWEILEFGHFWFHLGTPIDKVVSRCDVSVWGQRSHSSTLVRRL